METLQIPGRDGKHADVRRFSLSVTDGPDRGKSLQSSGDRAVVGSGESADLLVGDPTVSRFHLEVTLDEGRPLVHRRSK